MKIKRKGLTFLNYDFQNLNHAGYYFNKKCVIGKIKHDTDFSADEKRVQENT